MELVGIAYIAISLLSLALSYGIYKKGDVETKQWQDKINKNKISYSDVLSLVNKIKNKASALSLNKRNRLANQLGQIGNATYQSSGLSEQLMGDLRNRLNKVADEIDRLRNLGDVESSMADNLVSAYAGLSDEEKSKSKKGTKNNNGQIEIDPITKKVKSPFDNLQVAGDSLSAWDTDTIGGRTMAEAEQHAAKAQEYYNQANALGEKYAK